MPEREDRPADTVGKAGVDAAQPFEQFVAGGLLGFVQDGAEPFDRGMGEGGHRHAAVIGGEGAADPGHGFGQHLVGARYGMGDAARDVARQQAERGGRLWHRQLGQQDGRDLDRFGAQDRRDRRGFEREHRGPGVKPAVASSLGPQAGKGCGAEMAADGSQRGVEPGRRCETHTFKVVGEFLGHAEKGLAVDE